MKVVPCIICEETVESDNDKAVAKVCDACLEFDNLTSILKNIDLKKYEKIVNRKLRLTKDGELI